MIVGDKLSIFWGCGSAVKNICHYTDIIIIVRIITLIININIKSYYYNPILVYNDLIIYLFICTVGTTWDEEQNALWVKPDNGESSTLIKTVTVK